METTPAQTVKVEILRQTYNIRSDNRDPAHIQHLAEMVDSRMQQVAKGVLTADTLKVAILTALHIADELEKMKAEHELLKQELASRSTEYADLLDQLLRAR
ncbi:MAG TPA: cell division protein ZapA [Blastocatellia bacterium]|jgi:cell division protein ZapA|nr:cell division protein ZapA [Blastocatellia bacterium]